MENFNTIYMETGSLIRYNLALSHVSYDGNRLSGKLVKNPAMSARFYGQTTRKPDAEEITQIKVEIVVTNASYLGNAKFGPWQLQQSLVNKKEARCHFL